MLTGESENRDKTEKCENIQLSIAKTVNRGKIMSNFMKSVFAYHKN